MATLDSVILTMDRLGVADIVLPFILIFTVVYAVLKKVPILGESNDKFNVIFALVMALAAIFPHVTGRGPDVVSVINRALPNVGVVAIAIIMLLFLLGVWGGRWSFAGKPVAIWMIIISIGIVVYIFGAAAGWGWRIPPALQFLNNSDTQALIITLLVFGIIVAWITGEPGKQKESINERLGKFFGTLGEDNHGKGGGGGHP
jgi:hypothetical protein